MPDHLCRRQNMNQATIGRHAFDCRPTRSCIRTIVACFMFCRRQRWRWRNVRSFTRKCWMCSCCNHADIPANAMYKQVSALRPIFDGHSAATCLYIGGRGTLLSVGRTIIGIFSGARRHMIGAVRWLSADDGSTKCHRPTNLATVVYRPLFGRLWSRPTVSWLSLDHHQITARRCSTKFSKS